MPIFIAPHKSGAHRIAAIALFRGLIKACAKAPAAAEQRNALRNITRNRFKSNAYLTSTKLLKDAFAAGYAGLDQLHYATTGNTESVSYMHYILSYTPAHLKTLPPPPPTGPPEKKPPSRSSGWENSTLAARPRPLSELRGGKRHIPVLVSANRIPFLRFKKPQSPALSSYIKAKMRQRQRRHDVKWELVETRELAKQEDFWDGVVQREISRQERGEGGGEGGRQVRTPRAGSADAGSRVVEGTWDSEMADALDDNARALDRDAEKNRVWARRMVEIIDREKELAEVERKERRMRKNLEHRKRKRLREAGQSPSGTGA